ncbi:phosphocholine-specific phospholipase C [Methylococcus geothermalis]|uniref:phospholipase C n=1 Tax=Methylococcus geothermalis TaxID=2681310 RepID=A0A858Q8E9_9GAMM|nr:phospholipase C, phosphocholine-specific [Methylococcus geothermalis]QJD30081.1 phospholipase C, phosphocholine-specific [Methylococcus geothermalis]
MGNTDRRTFLKLMGSGAMATAMPTSIARALEIPANHRTGTIKDVEHIVILTQENRSFDHYFGMMRGVRGFNDPRAVMLPNGKAVWHQPNGAEYLLPFRPDVENAGLWFSPDPPHSWNNTHAAWNWGNHDQWVPNKGVAAMTYLSRKDIPYHYALADAFTICDAYHCSLMGGTDANRYYMWTGWCGNDGQGGGPVIFNDEAGYDWHTYPERLQDAGITWKVYQDIGDGLNAYNGNWWGWTSDPFIGNYGDNSLLYFLKYQNAQPGDPLADRAKTGTEIKAHGKDPLMLLEDFRADVMSGNLPQVSWISAPETYCEHPIWPANWGAWYISRIMDILVSNPEVWSKTVFIINYDEEGGYFDHMVPPTPPMNDSQGLSTVDTVNEIFPGNPADPRNPPSAPYGLGMRVPMLVVSPWSKGGWVNSEVFDHTSLIRFIEARFADEHPELIEPNITPWRRAVVGDLTSAFDFKRPNARKVRLPATSAYLPTDLNKDSYSKQVPTPPVNQTLPVQEPGVRRARALPYALNAHGARSGNAFRIDFDNVGTAAAVFQVRSGNNQEVPRTYTVETNQSLSDNWSASTGYDLSVYGPNGFFRSFKGGHNGRANLDIKASYDSVRNGITLNIANLANGKAKVRILDKYTGMVTALELQTRASTSRQWFLGLFSGWYDLIVTVEGDTGFEYRLAGHVETGRDSISDPMMGGLI